MIEASRPVRTCGYLTQNTVHAKPEAQAKNGYALALRWRFRLQYPFRNDRSSAARLYRGRLEMSVAELVRVRSRKSHDFRYRKNQAGCGKFVLRKPCRDVGIPCRDRSAPMRYAEGVKPHSPGSPRSGAPWVTNQATVYAKGVRQTEAKHVSVAPSPPVYLHSVEVRCGN